MHTIAPERIQARDHMGRILALNSMWDALSKEKQDTLLRRIERSCFAEAIETSTHDGIDRLFTSQKFVQRYSMYLYRVISNLNEYHSVGSRDTIRRLISGEIDPATIAKLTSYQLCPEASQAERDEIDIRQKQKITGKVSRAYTCRKCGNNETIPIEYQARALDEASSYSIKCVTCDFVWRI